MSASNINSVTITGNLTRDPELRNLPSGTSVCDLRVAVNSSRKDPQSGQWVDKPNYFDVTVFGGQAESCARYLGKGRPVAVQGRLDWSEWTTERNEKRSKVSIIAETVQFLGSPDGQQPAAGQQPQPQYQQPPAQPHYQQPAPQPQAPPQPAAPQPQYQQPPAQPQAASQPQFQAPAPQPQPMAPAGQMPPAPMPQPAQMPPAPVAAPGGPVASPDIPF